MENYPLIIPVTPSYLEHWTITDYKYLLWVYGVDRQIYHKGHRQAFLVRICLDSMSKPPPEDQAGIYESQHYFQ